MPDEAVLRLAANAVGGIAVVAVESLGQGDHRDSGTFRLRIDGPEIRTTDVILKVSVPNWISADMVVTNARALQLAAIHDLAAPRLIAADLDGSASGTVATVETFLSGNGALPPTVSVARLQEFGAAIAKVHTVVLKPADHLPYRPRPCAVDDRARERRKGWMPTTPLLRRADEQIREYGNPAGESVLLHGDVWGGKHAVGRRPLPRAD